MSEHWLNNGEVEVTLTFRMPRDHISENAGEIADRISEGKTEGITEEGTASHLIRTHPPCCGYIHWSIKDSPSW